MKPFINNCDDIMTYQTLLKPGGFFGLTCFA